MMNFSLSLFWNLKYLHNNIKVNHLKSIYESRIVLKLFNIALTHINFHQYFTFQHVMYSYDIHVG